MTTKRAVVVWFSILPVGRVNVLSRRAECLIANRLIVRDPIILRLTAVVLGVARHHGFGPLAEIQQLLNKVFGFVHTFFDYSYRGRGVMGCSSPSRSVFPETIPSMRQREDLRSHYTSSLGRRVRACGIPS